MLYLHYGEAFVRHASLDEIDHEIRCAEITLRDAEECPADLGAHLTADQARDTIQWLRELRASRTEHVAGLVSDAHRPQPV